MKGFRFFVAVLAGWALLTVPVYGQPFNDADRLADATSFQNALEYNRSGTATRWRNPDTAQSGGTVPLRTFQTGDGVYCREFQQTIIIDGRQERGYGTACRQPDGHWRIIDPSALRAGGQPAAQVSQVRVYHPPRNYTYPSRYAYPPSYRYPYGYSPYFPASLSLSFGYIKHKGHAHYRSHDFGRGHKHHGHYRKAGHHHFKKGHVRGSRHSGKGWRGHRGR